MNYVRELQQIYPAGEARAIYRLVMEVGFGLSHTDLLLGKDTELSADEHAKLENIMHRLLQGEPVQYVLGRADFCGRAFGVAPGVLIPRPETEEMTRSIVAETCPCRVLDIGTGSGCIAITLAAHGYEVTAFDISPRALSIACENASRLSVKVNFRHEDILHPAKTNEQWQLIVSNPPYVCRSEAAEMERHVLEHEPREALFVPDDNPLIFYRAIADYAREHLTEGGWLWFEINCRFGMDIKDLLIEKGFVETTLLEDFAGKPRYVKARKT